MLRDSRVLVADDDPELLGAVADSLERLGAIVTRAETGGELIERLADDGPFALVVTDVSMPWMSGLQAMHTVRYAGLNTPIIVMTALKDIGISDDVTRLGRRAILLRKPFDLAELDTAAERLLVEP